MAKEARKASRKINARKVNKFIYWCPRILSILFIAFLSLFSLDIFGMGLGFWGTILGLFMHNIPSIILLIVLLIAWKHEWVGGIAFILAGIFYIIMLLRNPSFEWYMLSWSVQIAGPAFLVGVLFFVGWIMKRKG